VLNQEITVSGVEEATSLGAAILDGVVAVIYAAIPSAHQELRHAESLIEPIADEVAFYDAAFRKVYGRLYPSLRNVHHEIEDLLSDG